MASEYGTNARTAVRWAGQMLQPVLTGPQRPLDQLASLHAAREHLDRAEGLLVAAARDGGYSFGAIGKALGVSPQAARQAHLRRAAFWALDKPDRQVERYRGRVPRGA